MRSETDALSTHRIGTELAGYRIESLIAHGGMSEVYLAENPRTANSVALKILAPEFAHSPEFRERLVRESNIVARIHHPNILPIYDADSVDGALYIAMRYVRGLDLKRVLGEQGRLPLDRTLGIMSQLASALDAAHAAGLVHGDVKPGNVLIAPRKGRDGLDCIYLIGFGITRRVKRSGTMSGELSGADDFEAPEQIAGGPIDARTDIYSLGCVLFECLAGIGPEDVEAVILTATAKDPNLRYQTCAELIADLREAMVGGIPGAGSTTLLPEAEPEVEPLVIELEVEPVVLPPTEPTDIETFVEEKPAAEIDEPESAPVESARLESILRDIALAATATAPTKPRQVARASAPTPPATVAPAAPIAPAKTRKDPAPRETPSGSNDGRKKRLIAVVVVAVILLLGGAAVLAMTRGRTTSASSSHVSQTSPGPGSSSGPPAAAGPVTHPSNLKGASTRSSITLSWGAPSVGAPKEYMIVRGGKSWTTSNTRFTESKLPPASTFTYTLYAVAQDGSKSAPVTKKIATATPKQWDGLLSGSYAAHVSSSHPYNDTWRFAASCKTGPCGAVWTESAYPGIRAGLSFHGKTYQGTSNTATFAATCNGVHIPSYVTMRITQIHSKLVGGKWKVVRFSGWMYVVVPATYSCSSGQFSTTFTASA